METAAHNLHYEWIKLSYTEMKHKLSEVLASEDKSVLLDYIKHISVMDIRIFHGDLLQLVLQICDVTRTKECDSIYLNIFTCLNKKELNKYIEYIPTEYIKSCSASVLRRIDWSLWKNLESKADLLNKAGFKHTDTGQYIGYYEGLDVLEYDKLSYKLTGYKLYNEIRPGRVSALFSLEDCLMLTKSNTIIVSHITRTHGIMDIMIEQMKLAYKKNNLTQYIMDNIDSLQWNCIIAEPDHLSWLSPEKHMFTETCDKATLITVVHMLIDLNSCVKGKLKKETAARLIYTCLAECCNLYEDQYDADIYQKFAIVLLKKLQEFSERNQLTWSTLYYQRLLSYCLTYMVGISDTCHLYSHIRHPIAELMTKQCLIQKRVQEFLLNLDVLRNGDDITYLQ